MTVLTLRTLVVVTTRLTGPFLIMSASIISFKLVSLDRILVRVLRVRVRG